MAKREIVSSLTRPRWCFRLPHLPKPIRLSSRLFTSRSKDLALYIAHISWPHIIQVLCWYTPPPCATMVLFIVAHDYCWPPTIILVFGLLCKIVVSCGFLVMRCEMFSIIFSFMVKLNFKFESGAKFNAGMAETILAHRVARKWFGLFLYNPQHIQNWWKKKRIQIWVKRSSVLRGIKM